MMFLDRTQMVSKLRGINERLGNKSTPAIKLSIWFQRVELNPTASPTAPSPEIQRVSVDSSREIYAGFFSGVTQSSLIGLWREVPG